MCLYPRYSTACTDQSAQGLDGTGQPWTPLALVTAEVSGLAPGVVYRIAIIVQDPFESHILERVSLELLPDQPVALRLSCLPWQAPTALPSSGQALVGQLPTVEGAAVRIDIP